MPEEQFKHYKLLLGSYGFGGYFGYFIDFRTLTFVKMYASKRHNLISITDVYEKTYIVNCDEADDFIERVQHAIALHDEIKNS